MNILLVNDDGVYAPGIRILKETLSELGNIFIVAPLEERSTTGHTLTLDYTLRIQEIEKNIFGCSGYPADCALMGMNHIAKKVLNLQKVDLVISGINRGANLGQDIYYSGTVAGAREATFRGIPSIAISSCMDFRTSREDNSFYYTASNFIKDLVNSNIVDTISPMSLLNINVPWKSSSEISGIEVTKLGFRNYSEEIEERIDFRGRPYFWIGGKYQGFEDLKNSDCKSIENNRISITPLKFNDFGKSTEMLEQDLRVFINESKLFK
jgi:5'-nucleotidase